MRRVQGSAQHWHSEDGAFGGWACSPRMLKTKDKSALGFQGAPQGISRRVAGVPDRVSRTGRACLEHYPPAEESLKALFPNHTVPLGILSLEGNMMGVAFEGAKAVREWAGSSRTDNGLICVSPCRACACRQRACAPIRSSWRRPIAAWNSSARPSDSPEAGSTWPDIGRASCRGTQSNAA